MKVLVIVPAAGAGTRFGGDLPKQFHALAGKPILQHVIERFLYEADVVKVVVAVTEQVLPSIAQSAGDRVTCVAGGASRQESVTRAFRAAEGEFDLVAVHDAVRPFFRTATFRAVLDAAAEHGAALPAVPVTDTIHATRADVIELTLDRSKLVAAQTPQCFRFEILRDVLERPRRSRRRRMNGPGGEIRRHRESDFWRSTNSRYAASDAVRQKRSPLERG